MNGFGFGFSAALGTLLNSFPPAPAFTKLWYWWDNISEGNTRRLRIVQGWENGLNATQYTIQKNTDAIYEIFNIEKVDLVNKSTGVINPDFLRWSDGLNTRIERLQFTGTSLKYRLSKTAGSGILRAIRHTGTFRGCIYTSLAATANSDKQAGYYYLIIQAGNYSALDASFTALSLRDIVQYNGTGWVKYSESEYTYADIDCYNATTVTDYVTIFSGLTLGTYDVGFTSINQKNPSSSDVLVFPIASTGLVGRVFAIYGGTPNSTTNGQSLISGTNTANWDMSTRIKKSGSAQTLQWIPGHNNINTLTNVSSDMQNWMDGVEKTGYNTGDQVLTEIAEYKMQMVMYAANTAAASEYLQKVTVIAIATIAGWSYNIEYETLIATEVGAMYSYMIPFDVNVHKYLVTDIKQRIALPTADTDGHNITDGANRKLLMTYNDTGAWENTVLRFEIIDPDVTNRASEEDFFLRKYGADYGKLYALAQSGGTLDVGHKWNVKFKVVAGYVPDLTAKVADYI